MTDTCHCDPPTEGMLVCYICGFDIEWPPFDTDVARGKAEQASGMGLKDQTEDVFIHLWKELERACDRIEEMQEAVVAMEKFSIIREERELFFREKRMPIEDFLMEVFGIDREMDD